MSDDNTKLGNSGNFHYVSDNEAVAELQGLYVVAVAAGMATITMSFYDDYHSEFVVGELTVIVT